MANSVLELSPTVSASQIESHLINADLSNYDLELPQKIHWSGTVGQSASIAQFIATWARSCESPVLKLKTSQSDSHKLTGTVSRLFGLSGVYFSERVYCKESNEDFRYRILKFAANRFIAMWKKNYSDVAKGRKIELISVLRANREFLPALYHRCPTPEELLDREKHGKLIVGPHEMSALFEKCLEAIKLSKSGKTLIQETNVSNSVGELLYEAYRNTAEHAYLDIDTGEIPRKGLRCVLFDLVQIDRERIQEIEPLSRTSDESKEYFRRVASRGLDSTRTKVEFIEISILDSGPGLAATMCDSSTDLDDVTLVRRCFEKHQSRKGGEFSGLGLFRILSSVNDLNGFIRLRTSSCEASYFASSSDNSSLGLEPQIIGNLANVVGTLLTISFPVVY